MLPLAPGRLNGARGAAILSVRTEDVVLAPVGEGIPVVVDVIETLGAEQYLFLSLAGGAQLVSRVPGDFIVRAGQTLAATFGPEKIHLFERESGKSLAGHQTPVAL